jgi:hypothetical protein
MKAMEPEIKAAVVEWLWSLFIGVTPLLTHGFLHTFVEPVVTTLPDNWTGETLFISITNSGLIFATFVSRGSPKKSFNLNILMGITLGVFLFSGMAYGLVSAGVAKDIIIWPAYCFLVMSGLASLYFAIAITK